MREPVYAGGRAGFWGLDSAAPLVAGTYVAARGAVDVALTAVDLVLDGGETAAYGLCRPPGHHSARSMYGGYCFFNNAAIAAEDITRRTGERVAIIDVDFHHGNGTQQIFWRRGDVRYVSIHAHPDRQYPYFLGRDDETGEGEGAGENLNIPLRAGATNEDYLEATDRACEAIAAVPGSVVVVSLGFDTYGLDPIGDFALTTDVYHEVGRRVAALGRRLVDPPGGRLPPAVARGERPGLAARRRGSTVRAAPRGRLHRGRLGRLTRARPRVASRDLSTSSSTRPGGPGRTPWPFAEPSCGRRPTIRAQQRPHVTRPTAPAARLAAQDSRGGCVTRSLRSVTRRRAPTRAATRRLAPAVSPTRGGTARRARWRRRTEASRLWPSSWRTADASPMWCQ